MGASINDCAISSSSPSSSSSSSWYVYPKMLLGVHYCRFASVEPFMSVFFSAIGFTPVQIGMLLSILPFAGFVASPVLSYIADKFNKHIVVHEMCVFVAMIMWVVLMLIPLNFSIFVIGMIVFCCVEAPLGPLADTAVLKELAEHKLLYGRQRLFATIAWGVTSFLVGLCVDNYGVTASLIIYIGLSIAYILVLMFGSKISSKNSKPMFTELKDLADEEEGESEEEDADGAIINKPTGMLSSLRFSVTSKLNIIKSIICHDYRAFLFFCSLFFLSIGISCLTGFLFLYLESAFSASKMQMGLTIFVTTMCELPFLFYSKEVLGLLGVRGNLIIGMAMTVLRTFGYSIIPGAWWTLAIEPLNGISFVLIWTAGVEYVSTIAPKDMEATAQGLLSGVYGLGWGVGYLVLGIVFRTQGPVQMFRFYGYGIIIILILFSGVEIHHLWREKKKKEVVDVDNNSQKRSGDSEGASKVLLSFTVSDNTDWM